MTVLRALFCSALIAALLLLPVNSVGQQMAADSPQLAGYAAQSSPNEIALEKKFRDGIVPADIRENMRRLSARPHHVGSPYDKDNAEWILAQFKAWGFDAHIETFQVLFPTPKERTVELLQPTQFKAKLSESAIAVDPTSNQTSEQLPTYNAYSADGDVTAPLVYVNYGNREDYEQLDRLGISVKGAIVIARYGEGWRGIKPKVAGEHGAVGCIIFSDPQGDGYRRRLAATRRRAAWQRDGHGLSRRSAHPRRRRHGKREAPSNQGRKNNHEDSGPADFVRGRAATACFSERSSRRGGMAWSAANHVSHRAWTCDRAPESHVELGHQARL
jgi:hypothetical protein